MAQGLALREKLFDKFSNQLLLLKEKGVINIQFAHERPYLCPICLREFTDTDLVSQSHKNFLTLEDAPPDALGGRKVALTCKECNSSCGTTIDFHLKEVLRALDDSYFYKGSKHFMTIDHDGGKVTVELTSEGDGTLNAYHRISKNDPTLLDKFIFGLKNRSFGPLLNLNPPKYNYESSRVNYALLKATYILLFSKFGYVFLLDEYYDAIREQLKHPENEYFTYKPFIKDHFTSNHIGMYYVQNINIKSFLTVFKLKTNYSETVIASLLPAPILPFKTFFENVNLNRNYQGEIFFDLTLYDPDENFFDNYVDIQKLINWIQ